MTQADLNVLEGFGAVWERVSGERIDPLPAPTVTWEEVLEGLYVHWEGCAALTRWAVGTQRKQMLRLAGEAKKMFCRAQTEYFLETGDIFNTVVAYNLASYTPYNLQKLCKNAEKLASLLQKHQETCSVSVGDAQKTVITHANTLKSLLEECLK